MIARHINIASAVLFGICIFQIITVFAQTDSGFREDQITPNANSEEFKLAINLEKDEFATGETIRLIVEGNQDYYLYVFAENVVNGKKTMLLPNIKQTYNAFPANTPFTVPDFTVAFSVDRAGTTILTAVATRDYVPFDSTVWEIEGDFYTGNIDLFEEQLVGKGLLTNDTDVEFAKGGGVFEQEELTIVEPEAKRLVMLPDAEDNPLVMVSSSCAVCTVGQSMKLGYSADRDGQLVLMLVEPGGKQIKLLNKSVSANEVQYLNAMPEAPLGEYTLIALYGVAEVDVAKAVSGVLMTSDVTVGSEIITLKGLRKIRTPEALMPHAVRKFIIQE